MPALAPHESQKATECRRNGSIDEQHDHRRARARAARDAGRPTNDASERDHGQRRRRATPTARNASSSRTTARSRAPATVRAPSRSRRSSGPNEREHERDVLARHREQVRETRLRGTSATTSSGTARVSPSRKPARSARGVGAQGRGAPQHECAERRWRRASTPVAGCEREKLRAVEPADGVPPAGPTSKRVGVEGPEAAGERDTVAGLEHAQTRIASSPVATASSVRWPPATGHAYERVGVEAPALRIVGEDARHGHELAARAIAAVSGECICPSSAR